MKARIYYVTKDIQTLIENDLSFKDFCLNLFKKRIYLSIVKKNRGVSLAINTNNIIFVEELIKEKSLGGKK